VGDRSIVSAALCLALWCGPRVAKRRWSQPEECPDSKALPPCAVRAPPRRRRTRAQRSHAAAAQAQVRRSTVQRIGVEPLFSAQESRALRECPYGSGPEAGQICPHGFRLLVVSKPCRYLARETPSYWTGTSRHPLRRPAHANPAVSLCRRAKPKIRLHVPDRPAGSEGPLLPFLIVIASRMVSSIQSRAESHALTSLWRHVHRVSTSSPIGTPAFKAIAIDLHNELV